MLAEAVVDAAAAAASLAGCPSSVETSDAASLRRLGPSPGVVLYT
jgi:hypothetical protein